MADEVRLENMMADEADRITQLERHIARLRSNYTNLAKKFDQFVNGRRRSDLHEKLKSCEARNRTLERRVQRKNQEIAELRRLAEKK